MIEFCLLVVGLAGLWVGSEILMRGAISLSDRFKVSDALFGMVVLAVGTDLPELFVAIDSSLRSLAGEDLSGIVMGSAIGSSIGQFGLVFGTVGFMGYQAMRRRFFARNAVFLLGSVFAVAACSLDGAITRWEGGLLIIYYAAYLYVLVTRRADSPDATERPADMQHWKAWLLLLIGLVLLWLAAKLTVASAVDFAKLMGLSNVAVSAVMIGIGSSLPELSVSIMAVLKNRGGLSVGNLVGSNVLDTLLVPGVGAVISPLAVPVAILIIDLPVLLLVTLTVLFALYLSRRGIQKTEAAILLAIYVSYIILRLAGPGS